LIVLTSSDQDFSYMHDREKLTNKTNHVGKHMALGLGYSWKLDCYMKNGI